MTLGDCVPGPQFLLRETGTLMPSCECPGAGGLTEVQRVGTGEPRGKPSLFCVSLPACVLGAPGAAPGSASVAATTGPVNVALRGAREEPSLGPSLSLCAPPQRRRRPNLQNLQLCDLQRKGLCRCGGVQDLERGR